MRVALLARVSSDKQIGNRSVDEQLRDMRARCEREGWPIVQEYMAEGESAFTPSLALRPVLQEAVRDGEGGQFDILMVHESSRFARNVRLHLEVRERLEKCGIVVLEAHEPLMEQTPEMFMFDVNKASMNEYWSRKMRAHIQKGYRGLHASGLPTGDIPFGYRPTWVENATGKKHRGIPQLIETEATAIRKAFADYASGKGYLAIATEWNAQGMAPHSKRGLSAFTASSVQSVIENRFYAGFVTHRESEREGAHQPIITEELWEAANRRTRRHGTHNQTTYDALLIGLVTCSACGGPIWSNRSGEKRHTYYWEPSHRRGRDCEASGKKWRADEADQAAIDTLRTLQFGGEWFDYVHSLARKPNTNNNTKVRAQMTAERERATKAYIAGALDEAAWQRTLARIDATLKALPPEVEALIPAGRKLTGFFEVWDVATKQERNEICRLLLEGVRLDILGKELLLRPRAEFADLFTARRTFCASAKVEITPDRTRGLYLPSDWYAPQELGVA